MTEIVSEIKQLQINPRTIRRSEGEFFATGRNGVDIFCLLGSVGSLLDEYLTYKHLAGQKLSEELSGEYRDLAKRALDWYIKENFENRRDMALGVLVDENEEGELMYKHDDLGYWKKVGKKARHAGGVIRIRRQNGYADGYSWRIVEIPVT
ncbi:MAG: hypothetical protein Q7R97_04875 [Candidatus Daviesbacteria bacterium]|nr:hypothetical protein [Candidatus Daviesbacteria bacterium]